jgi:hypothetical protein
MPKYGTPVTFDKAARLTLADSIQHIDPPAAAALRSGIGLTIYVRDSSKPVVGGLISQVDRKPRAVG